MTDVEKGRQGRAAPQPTEPDATAQAARSGQHRRVYERVVEHVEAAIAAGEYPNGHPLPSERALMERLKVSRAAVREGLFALQTRGFVALSPGARPRVARPGAGTILAQLSGAARELLERPGGMSHLQEARGLFECALARHAARHATPKQIEVLGVALARNRRALNRPEEFATSDVAFHLALAEIPSNPIFTALHGALGEWLVGQRLMGLKVRGSVRAIVREHERIFDAVERRDPDGAESAMAAHLASVARFFWKAQEDQREDQRGPGSS